MGKKVYTINGKMFLVDDETGKIKTINISEEPVSQRDLDELIKALANPESNQK
jgi:UDP-glucose 6-dehydrogenase